ncbi:SET domain-containing protein [Favolaschia claudopus]|uniref:SET domain-containing protein n=1 Tax=Favolaschia claudopus TaxID=2862362 RepID=A0AAW0DQG4_9AGAR
MSRTLSPAYACGCLNVRITPGPPGPAPSSATPAEPTAADGFRPVHVADEGIAVAHPQVTLRIRTRGELASRNRRARYTSLTCLICNVLVYRVHQIVSLDADGRDGPLMPTEDWVEQDILKSPTGWIEVHTQCLSGDAIARAEASPRYSAVFSVTVPAEPSPPTSPEPPAEDGPRTPFLAHLPPLFLPPPFTSAHPVFVYLANLAKDQSAHHRAAVEYEMEEIIRNKTAQLARTEAQLRHQVEILWRRFRDGLQSAEQMDASASVASPRSPRSPIPRAASASAQNGTPASPSPIPGTPVEVVRDFVPLPVVAPNRPVQAPAISSLSASLATSGFHHPRAQQQEQSSPARPASTISSSSRTLSGSSITLAGSPRMQPSNTAPARIFEEGSSVLQFGRKMNDTIDTAASYRYFQDVEADMARSKRERLDRARESENSRSSSSAAAAPPAQTSSSTESPRAGPSTANVNGNVNGVDSGATHRRQNSSQDAGSLGVRDNKGKGKQRKVTFESQPAIVTIQRNVRAEKEEEARLARNTGEEMIFDLEPEGNERQAQEEGAIITLIEQPPQPRASQARRTSRKTPTDSTGLPSSFMGLRPTSLPVPSNLPPRRGLSPPEDSVKPISEEENASDADPEVVLDERLDSRDQEIRKLVAADNPSHRGRWKKNSAEWKTLVSSRGHSMDDDFDDDDLGPLPATHPNGSGQAGMPASMPISIRPLVNPRTVLSLASYRPQTMPPAPTQESEPERQPAHPLPSSSVRRAVYAERDLQRERDPGALDFAADADSVIQEEEEEEREDDDNSTAVGAEPAVNASSETQEALRGGRERALRILQARNELPDSGMWRSLAT